MGRRFGGYKVRFEPEEMDVDDEPRRDAEDRLHVEQAEKPNIRYNGLEPIPEQPHAQAHARPKIGASEQVQVQEEVRHRLQQHAQESHRHAVGESNGHARDSDDALDEEGDTEEDVVVGLDLVGERSDSAERDQPDGVSLGIRDDSEDEDDDEDEDDILVFHWGAETGLRVLTEEDLYASPRENEVEVDEEADLDPEGDGAFFDPEEESEEARQARIQVWRDQNRKENRMPWGAYTPVGEDVSLGQEEDDAEEEEEPDWWKELEEEMNDDGECRFESPVEAYQRALTRLRKAKLAAIGKKSVYDSVDQEDDERLDEDAAGEEEEITQEDLKRFSHPTLASHTLPNLPGAHKYSPTGHLVISPDEDQAEHPIPQLLKLGERRWEEMIGRQSRTLNEAVDEYRRRYGRAPPKGFDVW